MKWVPFTLHIKITPANKGKRFVYWRDMQKISSLVYEGLHSLTPSTISIALPGGGQHSSFGGTEFGGMSGLVHGCAAKPQFGETPAQLQITGFYNSSSANSQPHPELERIHAGEVLNGPGAHSWESNPTTTIDNEVKTLKSTLESAINSALPASVEFSIFRLEYSGVIFGDRGYHFPR